jgi:hypothetical protein
MGKDEGVEGRWQAQRRDTHEATIAVAKKDAQAALKLVERQARRLRSAEARVEDLRLALDQEIAIAIDTIGGTLSDIARAAGRSRQATYDAIERMDARHEQQKLTECARYDQRPYVRLPV